MNLLYKPIPSFADTGDGGQSHLGVTKHPYSYLTIRYRFEVLLKLCPAARCYLRHVRC
jgi:hypothetical protein